MKYPIALICIVSLSGCASEAGMAGSEQAPESDEVHGDTTSQPPDGSIALGETATFGEISIMPESVVQDNRCPVDATCVWSGQIIVRTNVARDGEDETVEISNLEPLAVMDGVLSLDEAWPENFVGRGMNPEEYRFTYSFE